MSAIGAFPLVQAAARRNRETAEDDLRVLEQRLSGLGRRVRWLGWICAAQLLLMLLLDLIVYFPRFFLNGSLP
jgi:hypothetical protein